MAKSKKAEKMQGGKMPMKPMKKMSMHDKDMDEMMKGRKKGKGHK